jgi:putative flippase GtrA
MREQGLLQRWITFNGVGALGVGVQLAVLAVLVRRVELHYLWAAAIAVEAAVLHNFCWHERWTWRARPSGSTPALLGRLARFHVLNGAISIAGNLMILRLLTGSLQIDPLAATIVAIVTCSIVNFAASELVVFRKTIASAAPVVLLALAPAAAHAEPGSSTVAAAMVVDLQARTIQAWQAYEQKVDARYREMAAGSQAFFALDAFGVKDWRTAALKGSVTMSPVDRAGPGEGEIAVPDGKIHHWIGAIFVPNTTVDAVLDRLAREAGRESTHYQDVIGSKLLARDGDRYRVFLKIKRSKVVTVTYNTEHAVEYRRLGNGRASMRSVSTRIAELADAGSASERERPVGSDSGYLWRLNAYWRYQSVDGGVLIECESVSLSRAVPFLLRPFITGTVEGLARESLERTLIGLKGVLSR